MDTIDKYIPDFTQYLLGQTKVNSKHFFLSVLEDDVKINSNPLITSFIAFYLKNNTNIIFLANQESVNHYQVILKRFGINLLKSDNFCCIDLFHEPTKTLNKYELPLCENFPYTFNSNRSKNYFTNVILDEYNEIEVKKVLENINEQIKDFQNKGNKNRIVVMIDNLSTLPILEENMVDWLNALCKLKVDIVRVILNFLRAST